MAKNPSMFVKTGVMLYLFLMLIVLVESRSILGDGFQKANPVVACKKVIGVQVGDDCSTISQAHKLSMESFLVINPNIKCESTFVGQWVCVDGTATI
ncbi:Peptidoglycan-binding lysin domain-containing protein [Cynara cardunculus var. scolymus]|uniref:Peptidoglycan-binding lysin domain-containing protein n=1 Tax=Cynara cardunculus var. scolymus TaxID=59895 RepID=A0A103XU83_CYNCS|nr:Peptidoglycan-binding lysin domain-containing protein [Cynara cardunculus var. scolymus]